ncbi:MAG: phospholipid methyltransferase [Bacteroidetes bacterium]|nr:MAG: phospholipid methyltransferase [Bacteroidota bacterium]
MVGSMTPSSKFLAEKMLKNIDFKHCKLIVELGPGNGVFTRKILEQLPEDACLMIFELNVHFYELLKKELDDPRVVLIHDSAENVSKYVQEAGYLCADYVVSSLPLANMSRKICEKIIQESYNILKNHGKYIQFQYSLVSKKVLDVFFQSVHLSFTPLNFPPAFVYTCIKEK